MYGSAKIGDGSIVSDNAQVFGNSILSSGVSPDVIQVSGNAQIFGNSVVLNSASISGNVNVYENARVSAKAIIGEDAQIFGNATVTGTARILGNSKIHGSAYIGGHVQASQNADVCEGYYYEGDTVLDSNICSTPNNGGLLPTIQIATGKRHACSLYTSGRVRCWGSNFQGQLGLGHTQTIGDDEAPVTSLFVNIGDTVLQIEAGDQHTCALLSSGNVKCWGFGQYLGNGNTSNIGDNEFPSAGGFVQLGGTATQISVGDTHSCALMNTGSVRCWGNGTYGQLGYPGISQVGSTVGIIPDINLGGTAIQISAGGKHTCALLDTGAVRCWGQGQYGQIGYGNINNIGDNEDPSTAGDVDVGGNVVQISTGFEHTCALLDTGFVRCWGSNAQGRLGYGNVGNIGDYEQPSSVGDVVLDTPVSQVTCGYAQTCVLLTNGNVRCWGFGSRGQLGYGNTETIGDNESASAAGNISLGGLATQVDTGDTYSCSRLESGKVVCWGISGAHLGYGPGTGDVGDNELPSSVGAIRNFVKH